MAAEVLIDTSGFFALLVAADLAHARARTLMRGFAKRRRPLVTTDYILDETATLLRARGHGHLVPAVFARVMDSRACRVQWMDSGRFERTRAYFEQHDDQRWSFTDCFSFVLMTELGLREALTTDQHFGQAGFVALLSTAGRAGR